MPCVLPAAILIDASGSPAFDAATKVTNPFALAAFAIVAVTVMVGGYFRWRSSRSAKLPVFAWIVLIVAIVVPVSAEVIIRINPDMPYRVSVLVLDKDRRIAKNAHVESLLPARSSQSGNHFEFELLATDVEAANRRAKFYADTGDSKGDKEVTFERARHASIEIVVEPAPLPPLDASLVGLYEYHATNQSGVQGSWAARIEPGGRVILTYGRSDGTNADCNAVWIGDLKSTTDTSVPNLTASRSGQQGYFCTFNTPVDIEGTLKRIGSSTIVVVTPELPWTRATLTRQQSRF